MRNPTTKDRKADSHQARIMAALAAQRSPDYYRRDSAHLEWNLVARITNGSACLAELLPEAASDGDQPLFC